MATEQVLGILGGGGGGAGVSCTSTGNTQPLHIRPLPSHSALSTRSGQMHILFTSLEG